MPQAGGAFSGRLDDVSFYNRYLSGPEIRAQYLYQVGLVTERQAYDITIDNDLPSAALRSNTPYLPNTDRLMDINATDPTSSISLVQLGSQKDGEANLQWAGAPLCRDVFGTSEWCITFIPRGEGRYTLRPRAIDAVGYSGEGSNTVVYVDGTGPQITLNALPAIVAPIKQSVGWTVALSGTVNDPIVPGGFAGSGVVTSSLRVTLLDAAGSPAGAGQQRATVSGSNWQLDYTFIDAEPLGTFSVVAEAVDQVENATRVTLGTFRLDSVGPVAELSTSFSVAVSGTTQFSGTVTEIDVPRNAGLFLPFEEPVGATAFLDRYAPRNVAAGRLATQISNASAATGAGLAVDGNTDGNFNNGSVTQSGGDPQPWWQVDLGLQQSIGRIVLWNRTDCCGSRLTDFYVFVSPDPFTSTNLALTQSQPDVWTAHYPGAAGTTADFRVLDDASHPVQGRYVRVQLNGSAEPLSLAEVQVFSTQLNPGRCTAPACPALNQTGAVGHAAQFDGVNDQVRATPAFTLANASFSVAFWAKRNSLGGLQLAYSTGDTSASNNGLQIGFNPANQFICGFFGNDLVTPAAYTDAAWHHWACTYEAATQARTIYRDGVQAAQDTSAANYQYAGSIDWFIGSSAWSDSYFNGLLDEVAVFAQALTAAEVRHISQPAVAGVKAVDVAFTQYASGLYNEPALLDQILYLPLDDSVDKDGKLVFKNLAGDVRGTCLDSNCPKMGGTGIRGAAAQFDGDDNYIWIDLAEPITGSFTVAAWVKPQPDTLANALGLLGALNRTVYESTFNLTLLDGTTLRANIGTDVVNTPFNYTAGQWYHVAYALTPGSYTVYVNGAMIGTGAVSALPVLVSADERLRIGSSGNMMKGWMDEVRVFSRALALDEIRGLYLGSDPVLTLNFENNFADTSAWSWAQPIDQPTADQAPRFTSGQSQVGQSSAAFDGLNDQLSIPTPVYPLASNSFSIGFWARRDSTRPRDIVLSNGLRANPDEGGLIGFYADQFVCGSRLDILTAPAYADPGWHHWACTFDTETLEQIIYRDGVQVARETSLTNV